MSRRAFTRCALGASVAAIVGLTVAAIGARRAGAAEAGSGDSSIRYVAVSVATLWASPSSPSPLDRRALTNPADVAGWSRGLTTSDRLGLVGRIETQALLGEPVRILEQRGTWTKVAVVDQPTPKDPIGYPGWIPTRQLTSSSSFGRLLGGPIAIVTRPTAALRGGVPRLELSYGTRLPALGRSGSDVLVATPAGPTAHVPTSTVRIYSAAVAIPAPTGNELVATARLFLGLRYLWGGTSAFGFDCSGLVNLIYRAHGIVIPRDASAQALAGQPVLRRALKPGDLVFFATDPPSRAITHVAMYIGGGQMIDSPDSAGSVHIIPVSDLSPQYVTARRYPGGS